MILRLSAKLGKKIKTTPTVLLPVDPKLYADWSANLFTAARFQYILISNTVSLYSIVIFGAGITDKNKLLTRMINSIEEFMRHDGDEFIFDLLIAPSVSTLSFSKALNRAVIGSMNDLVFESKVFLIEGGLSPFDASKKINETPMSYCQRLGYTKEELLQMRPPDIDAPEIIPHIPVMMDRLLKEKHVLWEGVHISKDGRRIPVEINANLFESEGRQLILSTARDITERKRAEDEQRKSAERYHILADNISDLIFVVDLNMQFNYCSPSVKELLGYNPEEFLSKSIEEILTPSSYKLAMKTVAEEMEMEKKEQKDFSGPRTMELKITRKDGSTVWMELRARFLRDSNGQAIDVLGVSRDITERKQTEQALNSSFVRLRKALGATIQAMAVTVEARDPYTAGHQRCVADLARSIATEMGLTADQIDGIRMAGTIHDIGKISIPTEILSKPTKLTELEFRLIKTHSQAGYDILKDIEFPWPIARMVLEHHERMNGTGYPRGLTREQTLIESRILMVADVVEAMGAHRPYRPAAGLDLALDEISKNRGILYDPEAVDACLRLFHTKGYKLIQV